MRTHSFVAIPTFTIHGTDSELIAECRYCGAHRSDVPCMTESDRIRLEARILELEHQLNQPKHQRWQAPIR